MDLKKIMKKLKKIFFHQTIALFKDMSIILCFECLP